MPPAVLENEEGLLSTGRGEVAPPPPPRRPPPPPRKVHTPPLCDGHSLTGKGTMEDGAGEVAQPSDEGNLCDRHVDELVGGAGDVARLFAVQI